MPTPPDFLRCEVDVPFRFAHLADVHLGYQQYGLSERLEDFNRAWLEAIETSIREEVDFVLIAGDLFEKRNTDPIAFEHAQQGLRKLQQAKIPVLAIEGNHDRYIHNREHSWMRVLANQDALILLDTLNQHGEVEYIPFDEQTKQGAYIDLPCGARIIGHRYRGERLAREVRKLQRAIEEQGTGPAEYVIFMCHTGIQKHAEFPAGRGYIHLHHLAALHPPVDYVATGHIHLHFQHDNWLFQPGSLENCSSEEERHPHGFFIVEVDTQTPQKHTVTLHQTQRRTFLLLDFPIDAVLQPEDLPEAFARFLEGVSRPPQTPLVEVTLQGTLHFPRHKLDLKAIEEMLREHLQPLHVRLRSKFTAPGDEAQAAPPQSRDQLEFQVLQDLFAEEIDDPEQREAWTKLTIDLKQMALKGTPPEPIIESLDQISALSAAAKAQDSQKPTPATQDEKHAPKGDQSETSEEGARPDPASATPTTQDHTHAAGQNDEIDKNDEGDEELQDVENDKNIEKKKKSKGGKKKKLSSRSKESKISQDDESFEELDSSGRSGEADASSSDGSDGEAMMTKQMAEDAEGTP